MLFIDGLNSWDNKYIVTNEYDMVCDILNIGETEDMMKKQEEIKLDIEYINIRRAYSSSITAFAVSLFAGIIGITLLSNKEFNYIVSVMATFCVLQFVSLIVIKTLIKRDEFDNFKIVSSAYYICTIMFITFFAINFMKYLNSEIVMFGVALYLIFIPIMESRLRLINVIVQLLVGIITCIALRMDVKFIAEIVAIETVTYFVADYYHNIEIKNRKIANKLKRKTDSSEHDALTGLLNRRGLEKRTEAVWPYCERHKVSVGVLAVDIDFFKKYNDSYGHPMGDKCLRIVADVLKESAQRSTDVVTRTGGEEFLIFVQDADDKDMVSLALKIRKNLEKKAIPQSYCAVSKNVTLSMGAVSFVPGYDKSFKNLYEEADKALYTAKENGRNCIVCNGNLYGRIRNGMAQVVSM